jgi:3-dehydroquinate synthase
MKKVKTIPVKLKDNPYNIYIGHNLTKSIPAYLKELNVGNFGIIVTSTKIYSLYKKLINNTFKGKNYRVVKVVDGERAKSKKWLFSIIDEIVKVDKLKQKVFVICLGGGTIGDLGGFAAAIYKRGIPCIQVPTTLLGQIDASIGGKTAIDLPVAKNILGAFHQPKAVFIDPKFLTTLARREMNQGLAEAIKYGVIKDKNFFYFLKNNSKKILSLEPKSIMKLISVCAAIKAKIVTQDEKETKGLRTILNFGHTFAHALESSLKYRKISHGEAVAIGMLFAAQLSLSLGKCSRLCAQEISEIINLYSLPSRVKINPRDLYQSFIYDKKFVSGKVRMVLLRQIGRVEVVEGILPQKIKKILGFFTPS